MNESAPDPPRDLADSAEAVTLLVLDVDGVLTDGSILIDDDGRECKRFHVRDGTGLALWREMGGETAIITGRSSRVVLHRARELRVGRVVQGSRDKAADLDRICRELGHAPEASAAMGDDLPDLPMLEACGYPIAVADADPSIRRRARFVTEAAGGRGAVREAVEHLLDRAGLRAEAVRRYLGFDPDADSDPARTHAPARAAPVPNARGDAS